MTFTLSLIKISLEDVENIMEQDATMCMCITCNEATCDICYANITKNLRKLCTTLHV